MGECFDRCQGLLELVTGRQEGALSTFDNFIQENEAGMSLQVVPQFICAMGKATLSGLRLGNPIHKKVICILKHSGEKQHHI